LTLKNLERRESERLQLSIPLRVLKFDLENIEEGGFSEDTRTLVVSSSGASVVLRHPVIAGDSLRIINLTHHSDADFRVVGALGPTEDGARIWAVEALERREDFWGVECPAPSAEISEDTVLLQCHACGSKANHPLTFMELEVLGCAGFIILTCGACDKPTYWIDPNSGRPASDFLEAGAVAPAARVGQSARVAEKQEKRVDKRAAKRSSLKLPIFVRNQAGEQELSTTVDISKLGVAVNLFMKLDVGDPLTIICPYDPRSGGIEQAAEVRWRSRYYNDDFPRTYGLRFIR